MFIELSLSTVKMADLEAVLADVSYLMAMEKSKSTPAARASKKIILPDPRYVTNTVTSQDMLNVIEHGFLPRMFFMCFWINHILIIYDS